MVTAVTAHDVKPRPRRSRLRAGLGRAARDPVGVGVVLVIAVFAAAALVPAVLAPHSPTSISAAAALQGPSAEHWLGTDHLGRDIFSRIVYACRVEMLVGVGGVAGAAVPGIVLGTLAGYRGGWLDAVLMRVLDGVLAFPALLLAILFVATFGPSALNIIIVVAISFLPLFARLARASTLVLRNTDFVMASRAMGASSVRVMTRVILPNAIVPLTVLASLSVSFAFLIEASMSYLGFGIQPPAPSWGAMLRDSQTYMRTAPWYVLSPGLTITVVVLVFNLVGDRLRDLADPRLSRI